jgi:hypothetical protein
MHESTDTVQTVTEKRKHKMQSKQRKNVRDDLNKTDKSWV